LATKSPRGHRHRSRRRGWPHPRRLTELGLKLKQILITHAHIDHVGGALKLKRLTGAPILLNENDLPN
jgi:glyoxylase-like metal-dependent hydrolase (beta-lactamase superfamily II)